LVSRESAPVSRPINQTLITFWFLLWLIEIS
jgi:hypothetical protein